MPKLTYEERHERWLESLESRVVMLMTEHTHPTGDGGQYFGHPTIWSEQTPIELPPSKSQVQSLRASVINLSKKLFTHFKEHKGPAGKKRTPINNYIKNIILDEDNKRDDTK